MYNQSILIFFTLCLNFEKIHLAVFYVASTRRRCERQFKSLCTQENVIFKFFIIFKVSTSQFTINQKTKQKSIKRRSFILLKSDFPFMGDIYIYMNRLIAGLLFHVLSHFQKPCFQNSMDFFKI